VQHEFIIAGRRIARQRHRGFDVFRFASLYRNAGDLLAAVGFGKGHLKILRRVGAEVDRGVAPAVVRDSDPEFERRRCRPAQ